MNKKRNNKGFSLVELIVVIAVMAVLVVVLAPAYLRYVDKAKVQKDVSAVSEVVQAVKIGASEELVAKGISADQAKPTLITITDGANGAAATITATCPSDTNVVTTTLQTEINATVGTINFTSSDMDGKTVVISVYRDSDYNLTFTVPYATGTTVATTSKAYTSLGTVK